MLTNAELDGYLSFAQRLADAAGAAILPHFRTRLAIENKLADGFDPVTEADRAAERAMRGLIREHHPGHGILGEEEGFEAGTSPLTWVLDPIDGTRAFMTGAPLWGTLIALSDENGPLLGILDQPYMRERFTGARRVSHFQSPHASHPLQSRHNITLKDAVLSSTHPELFRGETERVAFTNLTRQVRMTRYGGDCYAYGLLAMGYLDLVVETGLKPFDIQALIPIVEGAGGRVTNWHGGAAHLGGQVIASGCPKLHDLALTVLASGASV